MLLISAILVNPAPARAEWQLKPFVGFTFGGETTFLDLEKAAGTKNVALGFSGLLLGEIVGVEADLGFSPGFFQTGDQDLVSSSRVTTLTGNVVVAAPRRATQYTLRPYFAGGAGMMRVRSEPGEPFGSELRVSATRPALDVGGGVTGFLSRRVGLNWDVRYFHTMGTAPESGLSFGPPKLSFWRVSMALAIRY